jgi:hypothetical protein
VEGSNPSISGENPSLEAAVATSRATTVNRPDGGSSFGPAFQSDWERRNADHMGRRSERSPKATTEPLSEVDCADVAALHTAGEECPTCDGDPQPDAGATKPVRRDQRRAGAERGSSTVSPGWARSKSSSASIATGLTMEDPSDAAGPEKISWMFAVWRR